MNYSLKTAAAFCTVCLTAASPAMADRPALNAKLYRNWDYQFSVELPKEHLACVGEITNHGIDLMASGWRDGFWLARWLQGQGIAADVIHPTSVAVSREHRRAKPAPDSDPGTGRLDSELLKRAPGLRRGRLFSAGCVANGVIAAGVIAAWPDPDCAGGGRQAAKPRARGPGRRAHPHCQPDEKHPLFPARACPWLEQGAGLARLGIRGFEPTLRRAPERLARLLTPEGMTLPPNTLAELGRDMARLRFVAGRIRPDPGDRGGAPETARSHSALSFV